MRYGENKWVRSTNLITTVIREFPIGQFAFQAPDNNLENDIGVSRTHGNFYEVELFL